ncbi:hypothetical protein [Nostocoides sp. Soil756]|uniref:hypothetical protein n=1 Tax=Nostocoides sp. Soil756 TaxID=1736399 RepID=UPI0006F780AD|nr:hypothetical protein [Tetrasphaera sp. Soil756]KRE61566.1 hypothetical protein ASG78_09380 [Tetrasphaera sp. Soil756]
MNETVGLVSATSFRVPAPGLQMTFGVSWPGLLLDGRSTARQRFSPAGAGSTGLSAPRRLTGAAAHRVPAAVAERAQRIIEQEHRLTSLHRMPYEPATRPVASLAPPVAVRGARRRASGASRASARWFGIVRRREVGLAATEPGVSELDAGTAATAATAAEALELEQRRLDTWWEALRSGHQTVVTDQLVRAFAEAGLAAAPMTVHGSYLGLAVLAPEEHLLPTEAVTLSPQGTLSVRPASKAHRARLQRQVVASAVLAAVRCAFAAAPGLAHIRVVVLRAEHRGAVDDVSAIGVVELSRRDLAVADLGVGAEALLTHYGEALRWDISHPEVALRKIPLDDVPELATLLARLCRTGVDDSHRMLEPALA